MRLRPLVRRWLRLTHGQNLIEYALIAAFVSLAAFTAASGLGGSINDWYNAFGGDVAAKSNCSEKGIAHSGGTCSGANNNNAGGNGKGKGNGGTKK